MYALSTPGPILTQDPSIDSSTILPRIFMLFCAAGHAHSIVQLQRKKTTGSLNLASHSSSPFHSSPFQRLYSPLTLRSGIYNHWTGMVEWNGGME